MSFKRPHMRSFHYSWSVTRTPPFPPRPTNRPAGARTAPTSYHATAPRGPPPSGPSPHSRPDPSLPCLDHRFSFFLAFFAWFAFAPLMSVIAPQLGLTDQEKWTANICSVASTVLMRFIVGPLCDKVGAKNLQVRCVDRAYQ